VQEVRESTSIACGHHLCSGQADRGPPAMRVTAVASSAALTATASRSVGERFLIPSRSTRNDEQVLSSRARR